MQRYKVNIPSVVSEVFTDEEAALINLKTGNYYSLNKMATRIWLLIEKGFSSSEINASIANDFLVEDSTLNAEIQGFIDKLQEESLILTDDTQTLDSENSFDVNNLKTESVNKKEYESPILESYPDMQELLLLDPIHEVEETNWLANKNQ